MITNTGKEIMVKYLLGQAPDYASYIALGCGSKPLNQLTFNVINKEIVVASSVYSAILTTSIAHNFIVNDYITVADVDTRFNGVFQITEITPTTVKYVVSQKSTVTSTAVSPNGTISHNYSTKEALDFEMFRVPIISRGYVEEDGVSKLVLTANIPSSDRYEITEIGVFSAEANPSARLSDSQTVFAFIGEEGWEAHYDSSAIEIPEITSNLSTGGTSGTINAAGLAPTTSGNFFRANSSNAELANTERLNRQERPRNLGDSLFIKGDSSNLSKSSAISSVTYTTTTATYTTSSAHGYVVGDTVVISSLAPSGYNGTFTITAVPTPTSFTVANTTNTTVTDGVGSSALLYNRFAIVSGNHIHNKNSVTLPFSNSSPTDELKLAFSVISKVSGNDGEGSGSNGISFIRLCIVFGNTYHTPTNHANMFAQMDIEIENTATLDLASNRYFVVGKQLQELKTVGNFTWADADIVSIFASVIDNSGNPSENWFVALDGLRFENTSSKNSLYGLTGYSVINNSVIDNPVTGTKNPRPVIKENNTSSFVEFRYSLDVT
jgi:hypothetical protein